MAVHFPFDITEWLFIIPPFLSGDGIMTTSSSSYRPPDLHGKVALVAGATRGVGRGIALALGEAGQPCIARGEARAKKPGCARGSGPRRAGKRHFLLTTMPGGRRRLRKPPKW